MNFERLRWGEWLAAISGLWLILLVFRAWYEVSETGAAVTAMDAFDFEHLVFIAAGLLGVVLLLLVAGERDDEVGIPLGAVVAGAGLLAALLAAYRITSPPEDGADVALGAFLGFIAAVGVAVGGLLAARDTPAAREQTAAPGAGEGGPPEDAAGAADRGDGGAAEPETAGWSPAPAASSASTGWSPAPAEPASAGWSPAAPAAPDPDRPIQPGDAIELTEGSVRFPAGTTGTVIETFGGGALIEVLDPGGNAERVEVPSDAFTRAGGGAARPAPDPGEAAAGTPPATDPAQPGLDAAEAGADAGWSPAMPAPAADEPGGEGWGFDESGAASAAEAPPGADPIDGPEAGEAAAEEHGTGEKRGFFARLFGRKPKEDATEATEEIAGPGVVAADEPADHLADWDEPAGHQADPDEPVPAAAEPDFPSGIPDTVAAAEPEVEAGAAEAPPLEPAELPGEPESAPDAGAAPDPADEVDAAADDAASDAPAVDPDPLGADAAAAAADVTAGDAEPPSAPEVEQGEPDSVLAEPAAPAEPAADEPISPEPISAEPAPAEPAPTEPAAGDAAPPAAAPGDAPPADPAAADESPAPPAKKAAKKPRKSSAAPPAEGVGPKQPEIGDEVELQVGGGKWDAGTRGTVVDAFAAGVIVEVYGEDGRAERLDLPFEAVSIVGST